MKKTKVLLTVLGLCTFMAGCGAAADREPEVKEQEAPAVIEKAENEEAGAAETPVIPAASESNPVGDVYEGFLQGTGALNLDYYSQNRLSDAGGASYVDDIIRDIPADRSYTLSEFEETLSGILHEEENYYPEGDITEVEYAYLDCGADGIQELALRLKGPFVDQQSELTLIIKEMDGRLQLIHAFVTWSRSFTEINEYGFLTGDGSNGATNHSSDAAYLDADGRYQFGYYLEEEYDLNAFAWSNGYENTNVSDIVGKYCMYSLYTEENRDETGRAQYYSYEVIDPETYEKTYDPNQYTGSTYQTLQDKFPELTILSEEEFSAKEEEKLLSIGATEEIRNGMGPNFVSLNSGTAAVPDAASAPVQIEVPEANGTVQGEMAVVEAKHQQYLAMDWDSMPQVELNLTTGEMFTLWDEELNSLWNRLTAAVTPDEKERLLIEQRDWIKKKDQAVKEAGEEVLGGSMQPMVENGVAWSYTRKRAYDLASLLAIMEGETFTVPAEVEQSFEDIDAGN